MTKYEAQTKKLMKYLKSHKRGITTYDAVQKLGIYRISARIAELREAGNEIDTIIHCEEDEATGTLNRWGQYVLVKEAK